MAVALVTGASQGFGRAMSLELAARGYDLVVDARRPGPLAALVSELESGGTRVTALAGDVTDEAHRAALVDAAAAMGGPDVVVCSAGTLGPSPLPALWSLALDDLRVLFEVDVVAQLGLVQAALAHLRERRGIVVAITSDAAVEAYGGWGGYGSAKAAFEQLFHVLGAEEPELRVYRFDPGDMRTRMHQDAFPGEDITDRPDPSVAAGALGRLLAGRPDSGRYRSADVLEHRP